MDEAYKDRAEELLRALHYADYSAAMRLLRSLNTMEAEQAALYAGFSTISRKAHGKDEWLNHIMRQFAKSCAN